MSLPLHRATRVSIAAFGVVAAIAGVEHGVGAVLQGPVDPGVVVFESWPNAPAYETLSGEPAMTIVPNLLVSGVASILVSVLLAVWAIRYVGRPRGGLGLIAVSLVLLLVGGGFGPPIVGSILGVAATRIGARRRWLDRLVSEEAQRTLSARWRQLLVAGVATWLALWPGVPLLYLLFDISNAWIVVALTLLAFALLVTTLVAAFLADADHTGA